MAYSRPELFQHFEQEGYSETQVIQALSKLAEIDSSINPSANEFEESIVEQMEDVFSLIQDAIASNKQLSGTSDLAAIEQTAINLASDRAIAIPVDTLKGLINILDAEAVVEAVALYERRRAIREATLTQLESGSLALANEQAAKRMDALNQLCRDPEVLDQILQDYGLLSTTEVSRQHLELTASSTIDFNVDEFLALATNEKKQHPKTIADTQRLAKSLITRSLR